MGVDSEGDITLRFDEAVSKNSELFKRLGIRFEHSTFIAKVSMPGERYDLAGYHVVWPITCSFDGCFEWIAQPGPVFP